MSCYCDYLDNVCLCMFATTKGHYGHQDIYEYTVKDLDHNIPLNWFGKKVVHIKRFPNDEQQYHKMFNFFVSNSFNVLTSEYNSSQNEGMPYHMEYQKDITKMFSFPLVQGYPYAFWFEDDWILRKQDKLDNISELISDACCFLGCKPEILSVRVNFEVPEEDKFTIDNDYDLFCFQKPNYTQWGPTFTFQPTIVRSRDAFQAYRFINQNVSRIGHLHVELQSTYGFRLLSDNQTPFAFFNMSKLRCFHIGAGKFEKEVDQHGNPLFL